MQYGQPDVRIREYSTKAYGKHTAGCRFSFVTVCCSVDGSDCLSAAVVVVVVVKKVKWSRYRPGVAHRVGRGIALLFHDRGTRRGWVVSSTPRPHFTSGKDQVPILQEAGWAPGPVWMGGKSRPHRDSIPDCPARSQSLYRLSYPVHNSSSSSSSSSSSNVSGSKTSSSSRNGTLVGFDENGYEHLVSIK